MNALDPQSLPLRDIHLPEAVSWWPPAPGWWLLPLLLGVLTAGAAWWWRTRERRQRRREALAELSRIEQAFIPDGDAHACARALSLLCRRLLLASGDRRLAPLTGAAAIDALERLLPLEIPPARRDVLLRAPYSPDAASSIERQHYSALMADLRRALPRLGRTTAGTAADA